MEIIGELSARVQPTGNVGRGTVRHALTAVDGTLCRTLVRLVEATAGDSRCAWRLHTHFDLDRSVPTRIDVTAGRNGGKSDEREALRQNLQADRCYVMDRWYAQRSLFNQINAIGGSYVCRVRDNSRFVLEEERPIRPRSYVKKLCSDCWVRRRQADQATYEMLSWRMVGVASDEELLAHLEKLKPQPS